MRKGWLKELNERDRDLYESDLAEDARVRFVRKYEQLRAEGEGYDSALDDSGERADDRQRLIEGTT